MKHLLKSAAVAISAMALMGSQSSHPAVLPGRPKSPTRHTHEMPKTKRAKVKAQRKQSRKNRRGRKK